MPLGPYKNFAACVVAQQNKGHSAESARKICGEIEKRTKEGKGEDISDDEINRLLAQAWIEEGVLQNNKEDK